MYSLKRCSSGDHLITEMANLIQLLYTTVRRTAHDRLKDKKLTVDKEHFRKLILEHYVDIVRKTL